MTRPDPPDAFTMLKIALDTLSKGAFTTDTELRIQCWNQWLVEQTGLTFESVHGKSLFAVLPELQERAADQFYRDALAGEVRMLSQRFHKYLIRLPHDDFDYMPQSCRIAPLAHEGQVFGTITLIGDVSERVLREQDLRRRIGELEEAYEALNDSKNWLATTLRSIGDAVIAADVEAKVTLMNPVAEQLTGWTASAAMGQPFAEVFHILNETTRLRVADPVADVLRTGRVIGLANHTVLVQRDGQEVPIDDSAAPISSASGKLLGAVVVFRDVTERRANEEILLQSEERFKLAARAAGDVIWDWNLETGRMWWSDTYAERFGEQPDLSHSYAKWWLNHVHPDDRDQVIRSSGVNLGGMGQTWCCEYRYLRSDGTYADILERAFVLRDASGRARRVIGAMLDLTAQKAAEREREELLTRERASREEAEEANRAKDEFLAVVSHELRTPLNAMLGWVRVLQLEQTPSKETVTNGLRVIQRNVELQTQLVDDLLDTARVISGKLKVDLEPVDLLAVIERSLEVVRPVAEAKHIALFTDVTPDIGPVTGDFQRLQQIVWNLLINAIKFTPRGGRVELSLRRVDPFIEVAVKDTGQGIEVKFLPYVFDRFRQSDASTSRRHMGLGLGLALVRSLVELHGGEVFAASEGKDQGATFTVRLPVRATRHAVASMSDHEKSAGQATRHDDQNTSLSGLRVLILDDNDDARTLLTKVLTLRGVDVISFAASADVLAWLETTPPGQWPAALICDIGLPDMDGCELMQRFRQLEDQRINTLDTRLPAIAVTAFAKPEDRTRVLMAGYQVHMAKPLEPQDLLNTLRELTSPPVSKESNCTADRESGNGPRKPRC